MRILLALLIAYTISQIAYDRAYQHAAVVNHSPEVKTCEFKPVLIYGQTLLLRGYFETGECTLL